MKKRISVVLVRPAGALNIGSVARAMMNTGLEDLVLVEPVEFRNEEAYKMAVSARRILERARVTASLDEAVAGCPAVFGVTARARHKRPRLTPIEAAERIEALGHDAVLVFGPEDHGLASEEVDLCQHLVGIPAHSDLTSYNLAQAVLLVCHALFLRSGQVSLDEGSSPIPANHEDRRRIETQALDLLAAAGYLTPNRRLALEDMLKRLVFRTDLETRDVRNVLAAIRHLRIKLTQED
jgi:TrmH family RNA methyltransferase